MAELSTYQSVTIWLLGDHFVVRGWHRGASHFLGTRRTLQEAADLAFATPRKEMTIGLKPREAIGELVDKIAPMVAHVTGGAGWLSALKTSQLELPH